MNRQPFVAVLLLLAMVADTAASELRGYLGEARRLDDGGLLYREQHLVRFADGALAERLVLYRCPDGQAFARKSVRYADPAHAPRFELLDARFGYLEGYDDDGAAFVRRSGNDAVQREALGAGEALVVDAGFDEFVRARWKALQSGERVALEFLVPSRLAAYRFHVRKVDAQTLYGEPASVFRLALSGVLGWFADAIDVAYRDRDRRLMRFEGLTNIRDTGKRNHVARIDFPPEREQPAPAPGSWSAAKSEPLTACAVGS